MKEKKFLSSEGKFKYPVKEYLMRVFIINYSKLKQLNQLKLSIHSYAIKITNTYTHTLQRTYIGNELNILYANIKKNDGRLILNCDFFTWNYA